MPRNLFILAGESSGDHHAAKLARALRPKQPGLTLAGLGGPKMAAAGVEILKNLDQMQVVGFWEVARNYGFFRRVFNDLLQAVRERRPDALICVDYPGFNLRFAAEVAKLGIPVFYYIVPQVWAWKPMRAKAMARIVRRAFCVFPFEVPFFERFGLSTRFVGHPLMDDVLPALNPVGAPGARFVALLPGSRPNEVAAHAGPMIHGFAQAQGRTRNLHALMSLLPDALAFTGTRAVLSEIERAGLTHRRIQSGDKGREIVVFPAPDENVAARLAELNAAPGSHAALLPRVADFSLVKSGTSTLEAGLAGNPLGVLYRGSPASFQVARLLVDIPVFSLVNIVLGRYAVPELLQDEVSPARLGTEIERGLNDQPWRAAQMQALAQIPALLGGPGASDRAAEGILEELQ